jgi:PilZ domain
MSEPTVPLPQPCTTTVEIDCRAAVRYPSTRWAACSRLRVQERIAGEVRDICPAGVGLILPRAFPPNTRLIVEIESEVEAAFLEVPARVIFSLRHANGRWSVGCEFDVPLTADELHALL